MNSRDESDAARPLIGLTGRRKTAGQLADTPETARHLDGDWYFTNYALGIYEAGGIPVYLPPDVEPSLFVNRLDGILLTGGTDISPRQYGAESETDEFPPEPERDDFEVALLACATSAEMPVLGICRGLQLINVATGGTLHQDVPDHARFDAATTHLAHLVSIEPDTTLASLYGTSRSVNSLHHQTVDQVGAGLTVAATADGTVEALEHVSLPIVAVQWHPEMLDTRSSDPIFSWLVERAAD